MLCLAAFEFCLRYMMKLDVYITDKLINIFAACLLTKCE